MVTFGSLAHILLLACLGLTVPTIFEPQTAEAQVLRKVSGQLRAPDGTPLENVVVELETHSGMGVVAVTRTDGLGKFVFDGIPQQAYRIRIRHHPYEEISQAVDLRFSNFTMHWWMQPPGGMKTIELYEPPIEAVDYVENGRERLERGDRDSALDDFDTALHVFEEYPDAHFWRGTTLMDMGRFVEAELAFERLLEIHPLYGMGFLALGTCRNRMGKYEEAVQPLFEVTLQSPDNVDAHYELARAYFALGKIDKAEKTARKAVELSRFHPRAHALLGNVLLKKGDHQGALAEYREFLRLDPNGPMSPSAHEMVAKLEAELGPSATSPSTSPDKKKRLLPVNTYVPLPSRIPLGERSGITISR